MSNIFAVVGQTNYGEVVHILEADNKDIALQEAQNRGSWANSIDEVELLTFNGTVYSFGGNGG